MWPWPWGSRKYKLSRLVDAVESESRRSATDSARGATPGVYPGLGYTETNPEWVLLYDHIRVGQIAPNDLRRMHDADLEYIAASAYVGHLTKEEAPKLAGNIARASRELMRRHNMRTAAGIVVLTGGFTILGSVLALVLSNP